MRPCPAVFKCLEEELGKGKGRFVHYSATELMPATQRLLTNNGVSRKGCGRPLQFFCNILGRCQHVVLTQLKAIERGRIFDYKQAQAEFKIGQWRRVSSATLPTSRVS